ncbi:MAG: DUF4258 domain-containing protein [Gemmataceae bacterium]|nr:DUF4258 domain-containing protein [Gemmataceae bacterium]
MAIVQVIHEAVLGCHSVALDEHAVTRMGERGVTEDEVIEVLKNPDRTGLRTQPNRFRYRKVLAGRSMWCSSTTRPRSSSSPSSRSDRGVGGEESWQSRSSG